mgnify:CR=1 FL=1
MTLMWVLLWLHIEAGMEVETFQIASFDNHQTCLKVAKQAEVMEIDRTVQVRCVAVEIKDTDQ